MALRTLVTGSDMCTGSDGAGPSNAVGALVNQLLGGASKTQEQLRDVSACCSWPGAVCSAWHACFVVRMRSLHLSIATWILLTHDYVLLLCIPASTAASSARAALGAPSATDTRGSCSGSCSSSAWHGCAWHGTTLGISEFLQVGYAV
jgi:hypothetical protein